MPDYRIARTTITGYAHCRFCGVQVTGEVFYIEQPMAGEWMTRDIPLCSEQCARDLLAPINTERTRAFQHLTRDLSRLVGDLSRLSVCAAACGAKAEARELAVAADQARRAGESLTTMAGPIPVGIEVLEASHA